MRHAVLAIALLLLAACASAPLGSPLPDDPFFRMAMAWPDAGAAPPPPVEGNPDAYRIDLRLLCAGELGAPTLTVYPRQAASLQVVNQCSFIRDFDVETGDECFLADPVVGLCQTGFTIEVVPVPLPGSGAVVLSWRVLQGDLERPIRTRRLTIAPGGEQVTVQLPATALSEATGRTRVDPGVETLLARMPVRGADRPEVVVTARVTPIRLEGREEPAGRFFLGPEAGADGAAEDGADLPPLLANAASLPPPRSPARYEVAVLAVDRPLSSPTCLDAGAAERTLEVMAPETLRRFVLLAAPEAGAGVRCTRRFSYHRATAEVPVPGTDRVVGDPEIGEEEVGFTAGFAVRSGRIGLHWRLSTLRGVADEGSREVPETDVREGFLPLDGEASLAPISPLEDGRGLVLLVRRIQGPDPRREPAPR